MPLRSLRAFTIVVLALLVAIAPRAAELCDMSCATHRHLHATDAAANGANGMAAGHCPSHATPGHALSAGHACQMHTHGSPLPPNAATTASTATATQAKQAMSLQMQPAILPVAAFALIVPPAPVISPPEHASPHLARSRPLTLALRI